MLARIESVPGVSEAWISQDGAFVVVLPRRGADVGEPVQEILVAERQTVIRLEGTNLDTVLGLFDAEKRDWIRGAADTRELTRIEADIVAARIADRVAARVDLDPRERRAIESVVAREFYGAVARDEEVDTTVLPPSLSKLRPETQTALLAAVALGFRPVEGER